MYALVAMLLAGLATPPAARETLLDFLVDGRTTCRQITGTLGVPAFTYEHGRLLAYHLHEDSQGQLTVVPLWDVIGWYDLQRSLIIVCGEDGILQAHALVKVRSP